MPPAETLEFQFVLDPPPQPPTLKRKAPSNDNEPAMNHGGSSPGNCIEKEILRDEARAHKKISPPPPAPTHPSVPQYRPEGQHMLTPAPPHAPATSPLPRVPPQQAGIVTPIAIDSSSALISAHYEKQLSDLQSRLEKTRAMADDSQKELIKEREKVVRMEREHEVALRSVEQKVKPKRSSRLTLIHPSSPNSPKPPNPLTLLNPPDPYHLPSGGGEISGPRGSCQ